jgi:hypothetical protein
MKFEEGKRNDCHVVVRTPTAKKSRHGNISRNEIEKNFFSLKHFTALHEHAALS